MVSSAYSAAVAFLSLVAAGCAAAPPAPPVGAPMDHSAHMAAMAKAAGAPPAAATGGKPADECCDITMPATHHMPELTPRQVAERYRFRVESEPARPVAGQETRVTVFVTDPAGKPVSTLQVSHERLAHLIFVSEDLSEFHHVHPEDYGLLTDEAKTQARFTVPLVFGKGGRYALAFDSADQGFVLHKNLDIRVEGPAQTRTAWNLLPERKVGNLEARLSGPPSGFEERSRAECTIELKANGQPVVDLEPYLGVLCHLAIFQDKAAASAHTHGGGPEFAHMHFHQATPNYRGPKIYFGHRFEEPGRYRIFAQFKRLGQVHTVPFDVEVQRSRINEGA